MSLGKQWQVIKQNWLISIIVLIVLLFMFQGLFTPYMPSTSEVTGSGGYYSATSNSRVMMDSAPSSLSKSIAPTSGGGVSPQTQDRSIVKTSYLTAKTPRGQFDTNADQVKAIVKSANGFVLYENVYLSGELEREQSKHGSYELKVPVASYDSVVSQLKLIGKMQSFSENAEDVTDQKVNLEKELSAERARLDRYNQLLKETIDSQEKIDLIDRIFNQERTISYLEESLKNVGERVSYATISLNLDETQSDYSGVILVKLSELLSTLVSSFNGLALFLLGILPWAIAIGIIWAIVHWIRNR